MKQIMPSTPFFILSIFLLALSACSSGSGSDSSGTGTVAVASNGGVNGGLTGDIWFFRGVENRAETLRFNMETGEVSTSIDGAHYINYVFRFEEVGFCTLRERHYNHLIQVRDTRTSELLASFKTVNDLGIDKKLSPDATRMLLLERPPVSDCGSDANSPFDYAVYSANGEKLTTLPRNYLAVNWLPDNRLVALQLVEGFTVQLWVSDSPHSVNMLPFGGPFSLDESTLGYAIQSVGSLHANLTGSHLMIHLTTDRSTVGPFFRHGNVIVVDLNNPTLWELFTSNENDQSIRATDAALSPDGETILASYDWTGAGVLLPSGIGFTLAQSGGSVVTLPLNTIKTPLPPADETSPMRTVVTSTNAQVSINSSVAMYWTPTVR